MAFQMIKNKQLPHFSPLLKKPIGLLKIALFQHLVHFYRPYLLFVVFANPDTGAV